MVVVAYHRRMVVGILAVASIMFGLLALALQRLYSVVPRHEIKRLAGRGDPLAAVLYRPVAYGASMRFVLWIVFVVGVSVGLAALAGVLTQIVLLIATVVTLSVTVWVLSMQLTASTVQLAAFFAKPLQKVMHYTHQVSDAAARAVGRHRAHRQHSGLYEKEDLQALLRQQKAQEDSRIDPRDIALAEQALNASDHTATDIMRSWSKVKRVAKHDRIGPVLLSELHKSGQTAFIVHDESSQQPIGTLLLSDAVQAKAGGSVADIMRPGITFVHEDFSVRDVLAALQQSGKPVAVVVTAFEETQGIITLQDVITQLLGEPTPFDKLALDDSKSVASWRPQPVPAEIPVDEDLPLQASPKTTEVIE